MSKHQPHQPEVLLIDPRLDDSDEQLALRYMRRTLDDEILEAERVQGPRLVELLQLRYGIESISLEDRPGQSLIAAVEHAFERTQQPIFESPEGKVFEVPWSSNAAARWFRERLDALWPTDASLMTFLATDVPTLSTACQAMDAAPLRKHPIADDPFPAPPILILGPTGVGKELLARAIHLRGGGDPKKFGAINCGGLSPELLESELFGHKQGAFTGAISKKRGFVAEHETVFLDEIGDMPEKIQVRLLRFLNSGEYRPVGENAIESATPRIISATNVDLEKLTNQGKFREDLYQRLRGRVLRLRPLRERPTTIVGVTTRFLGLEAKRRGRSAPILTSEAQMALAHYNWPGNMREMRYLVETILDHTRHKVPVRLIDLPVEVQRRYAERVEPILQTTLALHSGVVASTRNSTRELAIRYELHRSPALRGSPQSQFYRRFAALVESLGKTLSLADQLEGQVHAFTALAELQELEDRAAALKKLAEQTQMFSVDAGDPLRREFENTNREIEKLRAAESKAGARAKKESNRFAAAAFVVGASKLLTAGGLPILEKVEQIVLALSRPPLDSGARALGDWVRNLTVRQARRFFDNMLAEVKGTNGDGWPQWDEVRDDPKMLRSLYQTCEWNQGEMARRFGLRPETISRRLGDLKIVRPLMKNGRKTEA